jgi:hypothetical protein
MRIAIFLLAVLSLSALPTASAQSGALAMYIGPAPEYRLSIGIAAPQRERLFLQARIEFAPDCAPMGAAALDITDSPERDYVIPFRQLRSDETQGAYAEAYTAIYRGAVAARGGIGTAEYRECVRQVMLGRARELASL